MEEEHIFLAWTMNRVLAGSVWIRRKELVEQELLMQSSISVWLRLKEVTVQIKVESRERVCDIDSDDASSDPGKVYRWCKSRNKTKSAKFKRTYYGEHKESFNPNR